jgi:hypothetical protein
MPIRSASLVAKLTVIEWGVFFVRKNSINRAMGENARRSAGFEAGIFCG